MILELISLLVIIAILLVDFLMWRDQRQVKEFMQTFFEERRRWYAARGKVRKETVPEVAVMQEAEKESSE